MVQYSDSDFFPYVQNQFIFDNLIDTQRTYNFPIEIDVSNLLFHLALGCYCFASFGLAVIDATYGVICVDSFLLKGRRNM